MEPIKPAEGVLKDGQGQRAALNQVVYESYRKKQAQHEVPTVGESGETAESTRESRSKNQKQQAKFDINHTYAEFEIDQETREILVRIIDAESGKLVRAIPPDKLAEEIAKGNLHPHQLRRRAVLV